MSLTDRRHKLSEKLHNIAGNQANIYFEPPESKKLDYPAIVYYRMRVNTVKADNRKFLTYDRYQITYIHKDRDGALFDKILDMEYCEHDNSFTKSDMYHDIFTIYVS